VSGLVADAFYQRDLAAKVMRFAERARARGAAVLAGDFGWAYLPSTKVATSRSAAGPNQENPALLTRTPTAPACSTR
jgi:predicted nicotinamide N-methyase